MRLAIAAYEPSTSASVISSPQRLPSRTFSLSSISRSSTSGRVMFLRPPPCSSLVRCSMSRAVIGSPPTIATTFWAWTGPLADPSRMAATRSPKPPLAKSSILAMAFVLVACGSCGCASCTATRPVGAAPDAASLLPGYARNSGTERGRRHSNGIAAQRAKAELHHDGVVERRARTIRIVCDIIQGQDEAIVHVADADRGLIDLVGADVVTRRAEDLPVFGEFELAGSEDAFAPVEEPECG